MEKTMLLDTTKTDDNYRPLPPYLGCATWITRRCPAFAYFVCITVSILLFLMLHYMELFGMGATLACPIMLWICVTTVIFTGQSMFSCGIIDDIVDFTDGDQRAPELLAQANIEAAVFSIGSFFIVSISLTLLHIGGVMPTAATLDPAEGTILIVSSLVVITAGSLGNAFIAWGLYCSLRLVGSLLKLAVELHFERVRGVFVSAKPAEEQMTDLDGHCRRAKDLFDKANRNITFGAFSIVVSLYVFGLVMVLELVVLSRQDDFTYLPCIVAGLFASFTFVGGTGLLYIMTSVADRYEDCGANMNHDMKMKWQVSRTFPGPWGLRLLDNITKDHLRELSFNLHHNVLDGAALQGTLFRMALGATLTVAMGILKG